MIKNKARFLILYGGFLLTFCILSTMDDLPRNYIRKENIDHFSLSSIISFYYESISNYITKKSVHASPSQNYDTFLPVVMKPYIDSSYYMITISNSYGLGYKRGQEYESQTTTQNGVVILDFGSPQYNNGNYGTTLYDYTTNINIPQIISSVIAFCDGFWIGLGSDYNSFLTIIVGTNSSGNYVTQEHGEAWGMMINDLNSLLVNKGYESQISIVGGSDMETNFRPPDEARSWVDGYSSVGFYTLYNYGNASGCPLDYPPTEPEDQTGIYAMDCDIYGWTQDDVYYVSWESPRAYPFPEIYNTTGANAEQWYRIALFTHLAHNHRKMIFRGTRAQFTACEQLRDPFTNELPQECIGTNNTADIAYKQLQDWLNFDPYGRMIDELKWKTDIMWYAGVP